MHVNVLAGGDIGGRYPHGLSIFNDLATLGDSLDGDLMGKGELVSSNASNARACPMSISRFFNAT